MNRIRVREITKEVDRPQGGGGKGTEALYGAEILIDEQLAFTLQTHHFKQPGQFADFCAIMAVQRENPGAPDPLPFGLTRAQAIAILRASRSAAVALEEDRAKERAARGEPKKDAVPQRLPIDALLDFIEHCGFPAKEEA